MFRSGAALCLKSFSKYDNLTVVLKNDVRSNLNPIKNISNYRIRYYSQNAVNPNQEDTQNIYIGTLTSQIRSVKIFSLGSSIAGLVAQPILYKQASTFASTPVLVLVCSIVGFFTFITPLLLHLITKKYVTSIDYNSKTDTYTVTTLSFVIVKKKLDFKTDDVDVPDIPGMFTSIVVKGKPLFIEMKQFKYPEHYGKIMGYDKPINFKLSEVRVPADEHEEKK